MGRARSLRFRLLLFFGLLLVAALATCPWWLPSVGRVLVYDEGPAKADIAVVLGGDNHGLRILKAAELVRKGYVPAALVSGPAVLDIHECDLSIPFAVRKGNAPGWFICLPNSTLSTREESYTVVRELRRRQVKSFLLVTSDFHTARARRLYLKTLEETGGGIDMRMVGSPDRFFRADRWWESRESQKTVFIEWSKTIATAFGK